MTEDDLPLDDSEFHDVDYGGGEIEDGSEFEDELGDDELIDDELIASDLGSSLDDSVMRELAVTEDAAEDDGEEAESLEAEFDEDAHSGSEITDNPEVEREADDELDDDELTNEEPVDDITVEDDESRSVAYESMADEILAAAESTAHATPEINADSIDLEEDLLADDSQPTPQLWSQDIEIPAAATPVVDEPAIVAPVIIPRQPGQQPFVRKTKARELALQMLFQSDLNPASDGQDIADQLRDRLPQADLYQFAWDLYQGVLRDKEILDRDIAATATNWKVSRMAATDRNVLRLGVYELLHMDTPFGVVLDEAIDLAKKFGTGQSASFVNGVLDKLVPEAKRPTGSAASVESASVDTAVADNPAEHTASSGKFPSTSAAPNADMIPANASPEDVAKHSPGKPIAFKRKKVEETPAEPSNEESVE